MRFFLYSSKLTVPVFSNTNLSNSGTFELSPSTLLPLAKAKVGSSFLLMTSSGTGARVVWTGRVAAGTRPWTGTAGTGKKSWWW